MALRPTTLSVFLILLSCLVTPAVADRPIREVVPDLNHIRKWDDSNGDTADPFWADDDGLYAFMCDGRGFGKDKRNVNFNRLGNGDWASLAGELINSMPDYGKSNEKGEDNATWKVCGQECIDGVFYAFVSRNVYGHENKSDPLMRQSSFNASLIKSTDRGRTWTRAATENYATPMWPGTRFGAPGFFHYGKDGGAATQDDADKFVYALSNNGIWNGGDDFILGRVERKEMPLLQASDWSYYAGKPDAWTSELGKAVPILSRPAKLGWTSPTYVPALQRYLLVSWYVTPTLRQWFQPEEVVYDFFEAPHPWGPWTQVPSSLSDRFIVGGHMYGPSFRKPAPTACASGCSPRVVPLRTSHPGFIKCGASRLCSKPKRRPHRAPSTITIRPSCIRERGHRFPSLRVITTEATCMPRKGRGIRSNSLLKAPASNLSLKSSAISGRSRSSSTTSRAAL